MPSLLSSSSRRPEPSGLVIIGALPARRAIWPVRMFAILAAAVVAAGLAGMASQIGLAVLAVVVGLACAAAVVVLDVRALQRGRLFDKAVESVCPFIGARTPSRELVRATKWTREWVGVPKRIVIRYASTVDDIDARFVENVLEQLGRRLDAEYRVAKHNRQRCVLIIELDPEGLTAKTPEVIRATQVVKDLLGASAKVKVEAAADGPVHSIEVHHDMGARTAFLAYRQRIENVQAARLPGRWRAKWDLEKDRVLFEVRPVMPTMVVHEPPAQIPALTHSSYKACRVPFVVDEDGRVQFWQPSVSPHMLIIGGTGSGKTASEHTLVTAFALLGWRIWILDGKRVEFAGFRDYPNVELVAAKTGDQVRMIHAAHELMEERYTLIEEGRARVDEFEPLLLVIDEYVTFKGRVQRWYKTVKPKGAPAQPPVFDLVADLLRLARTAKIHLVLGTQRPDAEFLGGEMRDNFGARFSLGRLSPQGANMMWDSFTIGVAMPRNVRGRGVTLDEHSNPVEVQGFFTPDPKNVTEDDVDERKILDALRPAVISHPRKMIVPPEPETDLDSGDIIDADYNAWMHARIVDYTPDDDETDSPAATTVESSRPARELEVEIDVEELESAALVEDDFEGYDEQDTARVDDLNAGDLVMVDNLWGIVENPAAPDLLEEGNIAIDFRYFDTGEPSTVSMPEGETVTVRRPQP